MPMPHPSCHGTSYSQTDAECSETRLCTWMHRHDLRSAFALFQGSPMRKPPEGASISCFEGLERSSRSSSSNNSSSSAAVLNLRLSTKCSRHVASATAVARVHALHKKRTRATTLGSSWGGQGISDRSVDRYVCTHSSGK